MPDDELAFAVRLLVGDVRRIDASELVVQVARVFGWERTSAGIGSRIEAAVEQLLFSEQIRR